MNMEFLSDPTVIAAALIGFVIGILIKSLFTPARDPESGAHKRNSVYEKSKLEKELLVDKIKQLEAKVNTLEKALEMAGNS